MASLMIVEDEDDLLIITKDGMIIRQRVADISLVSRNTQGVRLINLNPKDKVKDITYIPSEPDEAAILDEADKLQQEIHETPKINDDINGVENDENTVLSNVSEDDETDM
jgi:DNA gyrase subunit A